MTSDSDPLEVDSQLGRGDIAIVSRPFTSFSSSRHLYFLAIASNPPRSSRLHTICLHMLVLLLARGLRQGRAQIATREKWGPSHRSSWPICSRDLGSHFMNHITTIGTLEKGMESQC